MTAGTHPLWDDTRWVPYPPAPAAIEADLCVIGLGGTGLAAVRQGLDRGLRVVAIERERVGAGAAGRNGGFLLAGLAAFHHDAARALGAERATALYEATLEQLARIAEETPEAVRCTGSVRLATSPEEVEDCQAQLARMERDGLPARWHEGPEGVGLLFPRDASFQPLQRCRLLARRLADRGARLHEETPALHVESGRVSTPTGEIRAGIIVLASDGGLGALAPALAPLVRPARLQMLGTEPAPEVQVPRPVYARYGMEYWQQLPDGRVVLGGFRDLGGDTEWTEDTAPTPVIQHALERFLRERLGVTAPVTRRWAATVAFTRKGILPVLAEVLPGVWAMGGYNGTGNLVGPLCARAAVEMAVEGRSALGELLRAKRQSAEHP